MLLLPEAVDKLPNEPNATPIINPQPPGVSSNNYRKKCDHKIEMLGDDLLTLGFQSYKKPVPSQIINF